jgi:hypothetical protein
VVTQVRISFVPTSDGGNGEAMSNLSWLEEYRWRKDDSISMPEKRT